jgi:predicted DNA binding protein
LWKINKGIEVLLTLKRSDCEVTNYPFGNFPGTTIERLKIDGKTTTHRITFNSKEDTDNALPAIKKIAIDALKTGNKIIWAKASCCSACSVIGSSDSVVLGSKAINANTLSYRLLLPNYTKLIELKYSLEENNIEYLISDVFFNDNSGLTPRETEIIIKLYENGYFDSERKLTMTQIAEQLNISTAALSGILRKTLRKIVKDYIESKL